MDGLGKQVKVITVSKIKVFLLVLLSLGFAVALLAFYLSGESDTPQGTLFGVLFFLVIGGIILAGMRNTITLYENGLHHKALFVKKTLKYEDVKEVVLESLAVGFITVSRSVSFKLKNGKKMALPRSLFKDFDNQFQYALDKMLPPENGDLKESLAE